MATLKLSTICLLIALSSCAHQRKPVPFDGKWAFCEVIPAGDPWACLAKNDVKKLKELLNACEARRD